MVVIISTVFLLLISNLKVHRKFEIVKRYSLIFNESQEFSYNRPTLSLWGCQVIFTASFFLSNDHFSSSSILNQPDNQQIYDKKVTYLWGFICLGLDYPFFLKNINEGYLSTFFCQTDWLCSSTLIDPTYNQKCSII